MGPAPQGIKYAVTKANITLERDLVLSFLNVLLRKQIALYRGIILMGIEKD